MTNLDQSGNLNQKALVNLGSTIGTVLAPVNPPRLITVAGTYAIAQGDSRVLVNVAGSVTLTLPSVAAWLQKSLQDPTAQQANTTFDNSIWIKDLGGHAEAFPISVVPYGTDVIDRLNTTYQIITKYQLFRLFPMNFAGMLGWYIG